MRWEKRETRRAQRAVRVCSLTRARSLPPACTSPRQWGQSLDMRRMALVVNTKKSETGRAIEGAALRGRPGGGACRRCARWGEAIEKL